MRATADQLRPYGYAPGKSNVWCAACGRTCSGLDPKAFKCRPCAVTQFKEVEKLCEQAGMNDA